MKILFKKRNELKFWMTRNEMIQTAYLKHPTLSKVSGGANEQSRFYNDPWISFWLVENSSDNSF